jgi:hypothetical protein
VLAQLEDIDGVESSSINEAGDMIRLELRPGADPERIAAEASRTIRRKAEDRVGVKLQVNEANTALQSEQWLAGSQITVPSFEQTVKRSKWMLFIVLFLFLGDLAIGVWLFLRFLKTCQDEKVACRVVS